MPHTQHRARLRKLTFRFVWRLPGQEVRRDSRQRRNSKSRVDHKIRHSTDTKPLHNRWTGMPLTKCIVGTVRSIVERIHCLQELEWPALPEAIRSPYPPLDSLAIEHRRDKVSQRRYFHGRSF